MKKFLFLFLISNSIFSQVNYHFDLLKDINTDTKDADIRTVIDVNGNTVFFHVDKDIDTGVSKLRLWRSDGLNMINYASSNLFNINTYFTKPTVIDDLFFFSAGNNASGNGFFFSKLGSSDIFKVADMFMLEPAEVVKLNDKICYGNDSQHEYGRLYSYDVSTNQSTLIESNNPNLTFYNPTNLKVINNKLFFTALTGTAPPYRRGLWVSDGTTNGTHLVTEQPPNNFIYQDIGKIGNKVIFQGNINSEPWLYISDGTEAGTYPFKKLSTFGNGLHYIGVIGMYGSGNNCFLLLDNNSSHQIWFTDGTNANTKYIGNYDSIGVFQNNEIASKDGFIFFTNNSGQLLKTDGNTTQVLKKNGMGSSYYNNFKMVFNPYDGNLYFASISNFYKTDGTPSGTTLISDKQTSPYTNIYQHNPFSVVNNRILAYTIPKYQNFGTEIYEIRADTVKIFKDLDSTTHTSDSQYLLNQNGKAYFLASSRKYTNQKIFETDGTSEGTREVEIGYLNSGFRFIATNTSLYLLRSDKLQRIDFENKSFQNIKTLPKNLSLVNPIMINNKFYFILEGDTYDEKQLWVSDGTNAGTLLIKKFNQTTSILKMEQNANQLYIFTQSNNSANIWHLFNENSQPTLIKAISTAAYSVQTFPNFENKLAFFIDINNQKQLWLTDGTLNGTTQINQFIINQTDTYSPFYFTKEYYFYSTYNYSTGIKIWKSDGTPFVAEQILSVPDANSWLVNFCECNQNLFWGLYRSTNPYKTNLYKYNLLTNETNFLNIAGYLYPKSFDCKKGNLYFISQGNNLVGNKNFLYTSDGTASGTRDILKISNKPEYFESSASNLIYPLNSVESLIISSDKFYDLEWFTFRECRNNIILSGMSSESKIESSQGTIISTEKLTGQNQVNYFAPKSITLNAGFSIDNSVVFKAVIKNRTCSFRQ